VTKVFRVIWIAIAKNTIHQKFIKDVITVFISGTGIVLALSWFPFFEGAVGALLAGSGIAAIIIGLAAQESLGNAFNGFFISISKPFEVGDRIHLVNANITGFIEDITIRHTIIRTFMNSRIIIPNSVISQELIENSNFHNAQASGFIDVVIIYKADVDRACDIVADVIGSHPGFVDTRTPQQIEEDAPKVPVFVRNLGLYGIELRSSMTTENVAVNFAACSDVRKGIIRKFEEAGIEIACLRRILGETGGIRP
jgi:small-conductance mechanosensitive channel